MAPAPLGRFGPPHLLAAFAASGLALSNLSRFHSGTGVVIAVVVLMAGIHAGVQGGYVPDWPVAVGAMAIGLAGIVWGTWRLERIDRSILTAEIGEGGTARVVVTDEPVTGVFGSRATGRVESFRGRRVVEPVRLEFPRGDAPPAGAIIDALVVLRPPSGPENGFDERTWLARRGIHVILHVDRFRLVGHRGGLGGLADRIRVRLDRAIAPGLGGERRTIIEGIVLGRGSGLSRGLRADFQASGVLHLLAVSGQNVVLVAAGMLWLSWILGCSRWVGEIGALGAIGAYVLAVGAQPSVIRAGVAGGLASLAWLTGRLRDAWQALLLAAVALLGWNPYLIHDAGFQLSFAAVVAIFTLVEPIARRLDPVPLPRALRIVAAVSIACGIVTAPIVWIEFGYLPVLGVVTNLLVEPAMPVMLGLAFVTATVDAIDPGAAAVLAWANGWVAAYIAGCARLISSLPFAQVTTNRGLVGVLAVGGVLAYLRFRDRLNERPPLRVDASG